MFFFESRSKARAFAAARGRKVVDRGAAMGSKRWAVSANLFGSEV